MRLYVVSTYFVYNANVFLVYNENKSYPRTGHEGPEGE